MRSPRPFAVTPLGRWAAPAAATALVVATSLGVAHPAEQRGAPSRPTVTVTVVDDRGAPLAGATLRTDEGPATTGQDGRGLVPLSTDGFVRVGARGHASRVVTAHPGLPARAVLPRSGSGTVSLRFGGDTMMGRRYYETTPDGRPPALTAGSTVADHERLLAPVAPLLGDADLTAVNLETPLVEHPYWPEGAPRPAGFNQSKAIAFASSVRTAEALRRAGVDVVSLANNHVYDGGDAGLASTIAALDRSGVRHVGAGRTEDEAWAPLRVPVRGRVVSYLGCTTVDGIPSPMPYVAQGTRGGAARCSTQRLRQAVATERAAGHDVVVMIHGAVEYERQQRPVVRALTRVAAQAGAVAVMNAHPHVVGGLTTEGGAVVSESLGNLVFDQDLWSTFPTYLARVDLVAGRPVHASADPLVIRRHIPQVASAAVSDAVVRIAAGSVPGPTTADASSATVSPAAQAAPATAQPLRLAPGAPLRLRPGWELTSVPEGVRAGSDLLFGTGGFEGDGDGSAPALWTLGANARWTNAASCVTDREDPSARHGVELVRSPVSTQDVFASPAHRLPVRPGQQLTLLLSVRHASPGSRVELLWYAGAEGGSSGSTTVALPVTSRAPDECQHLRVDVAVPTGVAFVQPMLRLPPPESSVRGARLAVDEVSLVRWAEEGRAARYDTVLAEEAATVAVRRSGAASAPEPVLPEQTREVTRLTPHPSGPSGQARRG